MQVLLSLALLAASAGSSPTWLGQTFDGSAVALWQLHEDGSLPPAPLGVVLLPAGSSIGADLFRCAPARGWCVFVTAAGGGATLFNVSAADGNVTSIVPLLPPAQPPMRVVSLHVDPATSTSYFTVLSKAGGALMSVTSGGAVATVADLTPYAGTGTTVAASICSSSRTMWLAVNQQTGGTFLSVDLSRGVTSSMTYFVTFTALWADCGQGDVHGVTYSLSTGELSFGSISMNAPGHFQPQASQFLPNNMVPNKVLSASLPQSRLAAGVYQSYAGPGPYKTSGYIAFIGQGISLTPVSYYLAGASTS